VAPRPDEVLRFIARSSKRIAVSVVGGAFVCAGLAMLVLPGPGILVVAVGFAILGTEYTWAAVALERTKRVAGQAGRTARGVLHRVLATTPATGRTRRWQTRRPPSGSK
jgi:hypothetical protein